MSARMASNVHFAATARTNLSGRFVYADERRDSSHRPGEVGERVFVSNDDDAFAARGRVGPSPQVFEPRPERDAPVDPLVEEGVPSLVVAAVFAACEGEVLWKDRAASRPSRTTYTYAARRREASGTTGGGC